MSKKVLVGIEKKKNKPPFTERGNESAWRLKKNTVGNKILWVHWDLSFKCSAWAFKFYSTGKVCDVINMLFIEHLTKL